MTINRPAARVLLGQAIDYAGLFPPASLSMGDAVAACTSYRRSADAWALGRFVVPAARLGELAASVREQSGAAEVWRVSALVGSAAELASLGDMRPEWSPLLIDAAEGKAASPDEVRVLAAQRPAGVALFVELVVGDALEACLSAVRDAGVAAKLRTGGVVPEAFPLAAEVARFLRGCVAKQIPFKLTAGLHHPVRGEYPLTYADGSARGVMYGYLNMLLASAHALRGGSASDLEELLTADRAVTLAFTGDGISWGRFVFTASDLQRVRSYVPGFGSCSFREPLDDLAALGVAA